MDHRSEQWRTLWFKTFESLPSSPFFSSLNNMNYVKWNGNQCHMFGCISQSPLKTHFPCPVQFNLKVKVKWTNPKYFKTWYLSNWNHFINKCCPEVLESKDKGNRSLFQICVCIWSKRQNINDKIGNST